MYTQARDFWGPGWPKRDDEPRGVGVPVWLLYPPCVLHFTLLECSNVPTMVFKALFIWGLIIVAH